MANGRAVEVSEIGPGLSKSCRIRGTRGGTVRGRAEVAVQVSGFAPISTDAGALEAETYKRCQTSSSFLSIVATGLRKNGKREL